MPPKLNLRAVGVLTILLVAAVFCAPCLASDVLPVVKTKTETYANVTLISKTATHAFVQHSRGVANLKLVELDAGTLSGLGISSSELAGMSKTGADKANLTILEGDAGQGTGKATVVGRLWGGKARPGSGGVLTALVGGLVLGHLFFSYCAMLICRKVGQRPGLLVWLPIVQAVPMLRAAGMPLWWLIVMLAPVANVVALVVWCLNISKARGKGVLTAILLMLPGLNLGAFLYLAFSAGAGATDETDSPLGKPLETEPLPA